MLCGWSVGPVLYISQLEVWMLLHVDVLVRCLLQKSHAINFKILIAGEADDCVYVCSPVAYVCLKCSQ